MDQNEGAPAASRELMWTDDLDGAEATRLRQIEPAAIKRLADGTPVRIVLATRTPITVEGPLESVERAHRGEIVVQGLYIPRHFISAAYEVVGDVKPQRHEPIDLSAEAILDIVADLQNGRPISGKEQVDAVTPRDVMEHILGRDPGQGRDASFGGPSPAKARAGYIRWNRIGTLLDKLVEEGQARKITDSKWTRGEHDAFHFAYGSKTGYVTAAGYDTAIARWQDQNNAAGVAKLRKHAVATIAERHQDEVEAELARLRDAAGI